MLIVLDRLATHGDYADDEAAIETARSSLRRSAGVRSAFIGTRRFIRSAR
ncbi:MAG TPA: hypothetical protein VKG22_06520 [Stellaceae bacterium]|nr:hypothetical protein [Stellaceae bacterium]